MRLMTVGEEATPLRTIPNEDQGKERKYHARDDRAGNPRVSPSVSLYEGIEKPGRGEKPD